jgi:hypothetical protein
MAHTAIVSAAFWGDVTPFAPIAEELSHRGHRVTSVPRGFHDILRGGSFGLVHLGTDVSPQELVHHGAILDRADSPRGARAAAELWFNRLCIKPAEQILDVLDRLAGPVVRASESLLAGRDGGSADRHGSRRGGAPRRRDPRPIDEPIRTGRRSLASTTSTVLPRV